MFYQSNQNQLIVSIDQTEMNGCSLVSGENDSISNWTNASNNNGTLVSPVKSESRFSGFESADIDFKRMSSRGVIPRAKIKTIKMTLVIIFGKIFLSLFIVT